jgi:hypothetical protein
MRGAHEKVTHLAGCVLPEVGQELGGNRRPLREDPNAMAIGARKGATAHQARVKPEARPDMLAPPVMRMGRLAPQAKQVEPRFPVCPVLVPDLAVPL